MKEINYKKLEDQNKFKYKEIKKLRNQKRIEVSHAKTKQKQTSPNIHIQNILNNLL